MLQVIIGPMFAGKTEYIIQLSRKYKSIDKKILFINHVYDNRYIVSKENSTLILEDPLGVNNLLNCEYETGHVVSHNGNKEKALSVNKLQDISIEILNMFDIIIIEEAQFFNDLVPFIKKELSNKCNFDKEYIVSGLSGDFMQNKIGYILDIIPFAEEVIKLNGYCTICKDGTLGYFTIRKEKKLEESQILVGGKDKYLCVCRKHIN
jgi:thymidine kinase